MQGSDKICVINREGAVEFETGIIPGIIRNYKERREKGVSPLGPAHN